MKKLTDYDFSTNPFEAAPGGVPQGEVGEGVAQQEQGAPLPLRKEAPVTPQAGAQLAVEETEPIPDQLQRGQNPDGFKHLISVSQGLEKFITESTDKKILAFARGISGAIGRLIAMDQSLQNQQTPDLETEPPITLAPERSAGLAPIL